jgi:predicted GNAT superfamily acetyltransferase
VQDMRLDVLRNDLVTQSAAAAESAARSAGLAIADIDDLAILAEISRLFDKVWSSPGEAPMISASTLKALSHAGNYLAAAFHDDAIVGGIVGFLGFHDGEVRLHSHILGVSPEVQGRSIGYALKQHQRAWALERGIATVTWTFDPLVRRNAYFNLTKLGAVITEYYENFYGEMPDGINAGQETDRVLVEWPLDSPAVIQASDGAALEPDVEVLRKDGAVTILSAAEDGTPVATNGAANETLLVQVPPDIVTIRDKEPDLARLWRRETRAALGSALTKGFVAQGMTRSGWYVLSNGQGERA